MGLWWAMPIALALLFAFGPRHFWPWLGLGVLLHLGLYFWLTNVSWIGWIALSFIAGVFWLLPFYIYKRFFAASGAKSEGYKSPWVGWAEFVFLGALWGSLEGVRSFLGWGWLPLAASQIDCLSVLAWARLGGEGVVAFLLVFGSLLWARGLGGQGGTSVRRELLLFILMVFLGGIAFGSFPSMPQEPLELRLGLVQPNVPMKFARTDKDYLFELETLRDLSNSLRNLRPDVILWPEQATPWPVNTDATMRTWMEGGADYLSTTIVSGVLWQEAPPQGSSISRYYNAVGQVIPGLGGLHPIVYCKRRLVPFGEYVPLAQFGWARSLTPVVASFDSGVYPTRLDVYTRRTILRVLPLVCYEDTFDFLAMPLSLRMEPEIQMLAVFINDGWFGNGAAQQHAAHSVLRAVEWGLPVVRVANGGISGVISPQGKVEWLPEGRSLASIVSVRIEKIATPYSQKPYLWRAGGFWALSICGSGLLLRRFLRKV